MQNKTSQQELLESYEKFCFAYCCTK